MALTRPDLQRLSVVPLKQQIVDHIADAVARGDLQPGEKLPAGRELAEDWEVGYSTINDAMKVLVGRGVLVTGQGKGTFVSRPERLPTGRPWTPMGEAGRPWTASLSQCAR